MDWFKKRVKLEREFIKQQQAAKAKQARVLLGLTLPFKTPVVKAVMPANDNKPMSGRKGRKNKRRAEFRLEAAKMIWGAKEKQPGYRWAKAFNIFLPRVEVEDEDRSISSPFHSANAYVAYLRKRGFEPLGSGAFSQVLAKKGSSRVIKVCRNPDNWMDYCLWASRQGYGGRFAPQVHSYKYHPQSEKTPSHFYVATMERLAMTVRSAGRKHPLGFLHDMVDIQTEHDNDNAKKVIEMFQPGLTEFIDKMQKRFSEQGRFDLHSENWMLRSDNELVLVDPVCSMDQATTTRLKARDLTPLAQAA